VEATHKALQEERARNAELTQTIASLQQAAEEGIRPCGVCLQAVY
jgi:cytidine deaminase